MPLLLLFHSLPRMAEVHRVCASHYAMWTCPTGWLLRLLPLVVGGCFFPAQSAVKCKLHSSRTHNDARARREEVEKEEERNGGVSRFVVVSLAPSLTLGRWVGWLAGEWCRLQQYSWSYVAHVAIANCSRTHRGRKRDDDAPGGRRVCIGSGVVV